MSRIIVDAVRNSSASADGITLASDGSITFPGNATCSGTATGFGVSGKILQVVSNHYNTRVSNSTAAGAQWHPSGLDTTITPSATSSKVLILAKINVGINVDNRRIFLRVYRGSTIIGEAPTASNSVLLASSVASTREQDVSGDIVFNFLDTPNTTSATTYAFKLNHSQTATATVYVNQPSNVPDRVNDAYFTSNIILQEVAA